MSTGSGGEGSSGDMDRFYLFAAAVVVAIAILAPILASSHPDGLESAAEKVGSASETSIWDSPFPDYTVPWMKDGLGSSVAPVLLGTVSVLVAVWALVVLLGRAGDKAA